MPGPIAPNQLRLRVCDLLQPGGEWDVDSLSAVLPQHLVDIVRAVPVPRSVYILDEVFWASRPVVSSRPEDSATGVRDLQKWGWISTSFMF